MRPVPAALVLLVSVGALARASSGARATASQPFRPDAIVVLGHRPPCDEHGVEYETRARVERAVALFAQSVAPKLLFSGGRSTPEHIEADVMADYAISLGVPAEAIMREGESRDTIENAWLSLALLKRSLGATRRPRIVLVTSDYHSERAGKLFRCAGAEVRSEGVRLDVSLRQRLGNRVREAFVRIAYWLKDECGRARGE